MPDPSTPNFPHSFLSAGQKFAAGRFTLIRKLGQGGMGVVWLARDERLGIEVALKFLPAEIYNDPAALEDLRREALKSRGLSHPNIIRIHDFHEHAGEPPFISMEYVEGATLHTLRGQQEQRVFGWEFIQPLVRQLCEALDYAHSERVIHRDLKPANVMLDKRGRVKLADFGIAAMASDSMSRISLRGNTSGTPGYMSPQQMDGRAPRVSDDVYSLGAMIYELLTSKAPFHRGDIAYQAHHLPPDPMEDRLTELGLTNTIPPDVAALVMACLAKEPEQRPVSARAVADWLGITVESSPSIAAQKSGLEEPPSPPPNQRRWLWPSLAAIVMVVAIVAGGAFFLRKKSGPDQPQSRDLTGPAGQVKPDISALKYGLYVHFGIETFAKPDVRGPIPPERLAPSALDVKSWARAAKEAGATFAVLNVKHVIGFCLWNTPEADYNISGSPVKGDLVADFIAACQTEGVVPGISYVISDVRLEGATRSKSEPVLPVHFAAILRQITELHTRYPGLGVQIFGASPRLSSVQWNQLVGTVHKLNPQCVILDETHEPRYSPRSVLDKGWFWSSDVGIGPASQLIQSWRECQAEKNAFILSVAPDTSGRIPQSQLAVLAEMKTLIPGSAATASKDGIASTFALAQRPSIPFAGTLPGTIWLASDSDGEKYCFQFAANGVLNYESQRGIQPSGKWQQDGNGISLDINNGFTLFSGTISGVKMSGKALSKNGKNWSWEATPQN